MDLSTSLTLVISIAALALGLTNLHLARRDRRLVNALEADGLLDQAFDALSASRTSEASLLVQRASTLAPRSARVAKYSGYVKEEFGDVAGAREDFHRCIELGDRRGGSIELGRVTTGEERISFYRQAADADPSRSAEPLFSIAWTHLPDHPEEAMVLLRQCLEVNPKYAPALHETGAIIARRGEVDEAREYVSRAIAEDPKFVDAMITMANLEHDAGNVEASDSWLENAVHADAMSPRPHAMRAALLADAGELEEALIHAKRAAALDPRGLLPGQTVGDLIAYANDLLRTRNGDASESAAMDGSSDPAPPVT